MYVKSLDDSGSPTGLISIADTPANKSREDYLLNFDYLYDTETISAEQYEAIKTFEIEIAKLNIDIIKLAEEIIQINQDLLDAEVKRDNAAAIKAEADESIYDTKDLLNSITAGKGIIEIEKENPAFVFLTKTGNTYSGRFETQFTGILKNTLYLYATKEDVEENKNKLTFVTSSQGNIVKEVTNIKLPSDFSQSYCYAIFSYQPDLEELQVQDTYQRLSNKQQQIYENMVKLIDGDSKSSNTKKKLGLTKYLKNQEAACNIKIEAKNKLIADFENMMGPALREGTWQPEDEYAQYGEQHIETVSYSFSTNYDSNNILNFIWDKELFDEEEENFEYSGVEQTKIYYPCIDLSKNIKLLQALANNSFLDNLIFSYKENANTVSVSAAALGSNCQLAFIQNSNTNMIKPVLMITNLDNYEITEDNATNEMAKIKKLVNPLISYLKIDGIAENDYSVDDINIFSVTNCWIDNPTEYSIVYPRLEIQSGYLKTGEGEF